MRALLIAVLLVGACTAPSGGSLIDTPAPNAAWLETATATWKLYGADWDRPLIRWVRAAHPCMAGRFTTSTGICAEGETAFYEGLPATAEVRLDVDGDWGWSWLLRHELLHARFISSDAWGDPDVAHARPEWKQFDVYPYIH